MSRRRGSSPMVRLGGSLEVNDPNMPKASPRRRQGITADHKSCALIQTRLKLGDIM